MSGQATYAPEPYERRGFALQPGQWELRPRTSDDGGTELISLKSFMGIDSATACGCPFRSFPRDGVALTPAGGYTHDGFSHYFGQGKRYAGLPGEYGGLSPRPEVQLVGFRKAGGSCGEIYDFSALRVATRDFPDDPRITIAPNPTDGPLLLTVPADLAATELRLYSPVGRLLRTVTAPGARRRLTLGGLAPGVYTLLVMGSAGPLARRRVIRR